MMRDLLNVLPDDRPITSLCVVEDPVKKPPGYHAVCRTYDQDTDADLWKEGFFGKKITRYLCLSKTEGIQASYIVDSISVINDKDVPPDGFTALTHTTDSEQKATKKRLICYRTLPKDKAIQAITDIIILSKSKKAPTGFTLAGDLNGFLVCFKTTSVSKGLQQSNPLPTNNGVNSVSYGRYANHYSNSLTVDRLKSSPRHSSAISLPPSIVSPNLPYPVTPGSSSRLPPPPPVPTSLYPVDQLRSVTPVQPPIRNYTLPRNMGMSNTWAHSRHYATPNHMPPASQPFPHALPNKGGQRTGSSSSMHSGIESVMFEINPRFKEVQHLTNRFVIPNLDCKSIQQIESEYKYDFCTEHMALQRVPHNG